MTNLLSKILTPAIIGRLLRKTVSSLEPAAALRYLFDVDRVLYQLEGQTSVRLGNGVHSKHRHIKYHDFFVENLKEGQRVLDIGSGNGVLDANIADSIRGVVVTGIELNKTNVEWARQNCARDNVSFVNDDALTHEFIERFDVVILSNVLEHIDQRVEFLKKIKEKCQPSYFLIRVPMFERDWRIPLQEELGIDYRLDSTHFIEYRFEQLRDELSQAGLTMETLKTNWGEYWLKAS